MTMAPQTTGEHTGAPPRPTRWQQWAPPVGVGVAAVALMGCLAVRDPNEAGAYPLCPFRAITGWDCPGCGSLRGLHALALGDVRVMADQNLLLLVAVPFIVWRYVAWVRRRALGLPAREPGSPVLVVIIAAIVLLFWVVRNLPGVPFLGSGIG
jgi:Protein of unknown function (DUF2752)